MDKSRAYIAIDLKSFYASVECVERDLDPLTTNLVVADSTRTDKTICLAVSPSLKAFGIPGRPRLFEVVQKVRDVNRERLSRATRTHRAVKDDNGKCALSAPSFDSTAIMNDPSLELSYIVAPPRMALYIEYSTRIYDIYLKYIAPEDIHVYSIDEVFIDATCYLNTYHMTAHELAMTMIRDVLYNTGITATAGIGTNLYLAKVAMDIVAKHVQPDKDGVRIAELDEQSYRERLWSHKPITDFWRVGKGYARKLEQIGLFTMGDIAKCSTGQQFDPYNEDMLYKAFGINAELLIDHAWGWEPCTIEKIKEYKPSSNSLGSGQVLQKPYTFEKAQIVLKEMTEALTLDLVEKGLAASQMVLTVGYDRESLNGAVGKAYTGEITTDHYGRSVPKQAHGSVNLGRHTSSTRVIMEAVMGLYGRVVNKKLLIRRLNITANNVAPEGSVSESVSQPEQLDLFTDYTALEEQKKAEAAALEKEKRLQKAILQVRRRYGKNAMLKGIDFDEDATAIQRNAQIGGHKA